MLTPVAGFIAAAAGQADPRCRRPPGGRGHHSPGVAYSGGGIHAAAAGQADPWLPKPPALRKPARRAGRAGRVAWRL